MNSNDNIWSRMAQDGYAEVERDFPVGRDTPTRVNNDGTVVNMSREAMLARVNAFCDRVNDKINPNGEVTPRR